MVLSSNDPDPKDNPIIGFAAEDRDDGAVTVAAGGAWGTFVDVEGIIRNEAELISRYRDMALQAECERALDEIVNEVIIKEDDQAIVDIDLSKLEEEGLDMNIIEVIREEFDHVKDLLDFEEHGYEIFRHWFVDGRINYQVIINPKAPEMGIQELRYIDARKIRKVREIDQQRAGDNTNVTISVETAEYYVYNETAYSNTLATTYQTQGIKIAKDAVINVVSGLTDREGKMVLSYLHKAMKPLNQLRMLEDATVIYFLARAPERRAFYIEVGDLPKLKVEQHMREMMTKFKNRLVYDSSTGQIRDDRKFMTMTEDYWLPRRNGSSSTQIETLIGGQNLPQMMENVEYFRNKLYESLSLPVSRLQPDQTFNLGRASEITRDELKFQKFVQRLRLKFQALLMEALGKQLVLKQVMTVEEWDTIKKNVVLQFARDNHFAELKDAEILRERLATLQQMQPFIGTFYSQEWVFKNVMKLTDDEIMEMREQIASEPPPLWMVPDLPEEGGK